MALAKITRSGLTAIAILVVVLWGCFFAERNTVRRANAETYRALRVLYKRAPRLMEPAALPVRNAPAKRPALG